MKRYYLKNAIYHILILAFIVSIFFTMSCNKENTTYIKKAFAIVYQNKIPYLINSDNETFNLSDYEEISDDFCDYIIVKKDNKYGFIDLTGKGVIDCLYDRVYPMRENKAVVVINNQYKIIDNENNVLYEFSDNLYSESYFSCDKLLITDGFKFKYLTFKDNEFTTSSTWYDNAAPYVNDYAVIGKRDEEIIYVVNDEGEITGEIDHINYLDTFKYTFINKEDEIIIDEMWDFADNFYDGYARVANMGTFTYTYTSELYGLRKNEGRGLIYSYINPEGKYLYMDYNYDLNIILYRYGEAQSLEKNVYDYYKLEYPYATNFNDDMCIMAKLIYNDSSNQFIKEYMFITVDGSMPYVDAIYYSNTSYRYGYDIDYSRGYRSQSPGQFAPTPLVICGSTYILGIGKTLGNTSYRFKYAGYDYTFRTNSFFDVVYDHPYLNEENPASWAKEYNQKYFNGVKTYTLLKNYLEIPYDIDNIHYSTYYSNEFPLCRTRITNSNSFGLVVFKPEIRHNDEYDEDYEVITATYLLPPIYDKIVY